MRDFTQSKGILFRYFIQINYDDAGFFLPGFLNRNFLPVIKNFSSPFHFWFSNFISILPGQISSYEIFINSHYPHAPDRFPAFCSHLV